MVLTEILLSCLTIIEFLNLLIRVIKIIPSNEPEGTSFPSATALPENFVRSELTEEMRAKIYS